MIYYARTDKGKVRNQNEDFIYAPDGNDGFFAVVADGMGGHKAGEVASRIVVDTIKDSLESAGAKNVTIQMLCDALKTANKNVWDEAQTNPHLKGMGSTATVAAFRGHEVIIGHVGDSRAYLFRDGALSQITKDHSYVQMLIDNGYITSKQAENHPNKNVITRSVGTDDIVDIDTFTVQLEKGDVILLCSDGLNIVVSDEDIEATLSNGIESAADSLVESALKNGGVDNISVVLAYMDGDGA